MEKHKRTYIESLGISRDDVVLCEVCGQRGADIHHIEYQSQGGKDEIENLIALCRGCHKAEHDTASRKERYQSIVQRRTKYLKWKQSNHR